MTPKEQEQADEQDALMASVGWEDAVDDLGIEDFPERDYFIQAGELLREAAIVLRESLNWVGLRTPGAFDDLASRIERFLEGKA